MLSLQLQYSTLANIRLNSLRYYLSRQIALSDFAMNTGDDHIAKESRAYIIIRQLGKTWLMGTGSLCMC